jgi:hypothetical protein
MALELDVGPDSAPDLGQALESVEAPAPAQDVVLAQGKALVLEAGWGFVGRSGTSSVPELARMSTVRVKAVVSALAMALLSVVLKAQQMGMQKAQV